MDMTPVIAIELGFRFDLVGGASTGAILAFGWPVGLTLQEMLSCDRLIVALESAARFGASEDVRRIRAPYGSIMSWTCFRDRPETEL
jgi:hypothetical protein